MICWRRMANISCRPRTVWRRCNFFFQAEDGIRYRTVTGVQTCALPISFDRFLILALHEIDQTYSLLPAPAQLRIRRQSIGFEEFGKSLVRLAHHQPVISDFLVGKRVFRETLGEFAACLDS